MHQEHKTKSALVIFAVASTRGQDNLRMHVAPFLTAWNAAKQATQEIMGIHTPLCKIPAPSTSKTTNVNAPRDLQTMLPKIGKQAVPQGYTHMHTDGTPFPCTTSILPKNGIQLYTEGSSMEGAYGSSCMGAGLYNATTCDCTRINAGGRESTYTNSRTELVALLVALERHLAGTRLDIYTDIMCSIHNTRKMLDKPHIMREMEHM